MRPTEHSILASLKRNGYKATPQRRVVIRAIVNSDDHLTPAEIFDRANQDSPGIGLVTVYRTLEILAGLDLVCELHAGGNCPSYTTGARQHHHHLICSGCGRVVDFTGHHLEQLEKRLSRESGFQIENHLLEFIGRCRACQKVAGSLPAR